MIRRVNGCMSKLILHIGMPKTGSSSIQESLARSLSDENFHYLNIGVNHAGILRRLFLEGSRGNHTKRQNEIWQRLKTECQRSIDKNVSLIISGEGIWHFSHSSLEKIRDFFLQYFSEILVVGYVRSPRSFMNSAFQQLVKNHNLSDFALEKCYPNYRKKFEKFDVIFERENVFLRKFDVSVLHQRDVVLDFCKALNINFDKKDVLRVNESLSLPAVSLLYVKNLKLDSGLSFPKSSFLMNVFHSLSGEKFILSDKLLEPIVDKHKEDVYWMSNRLGVSLEESSKENGKHVESEAELLTIARESFSKVLMLFDKASSEDGLDENEIIGRYVEFLHASKNDKPNRVLSERQKKRLLSASLDDKGVLIVLIQKLKRAGELEAARNIFSILSKENPNLRILSGLSNGLDIV